MLSTYPYLILLHKIIDYYILNSVYLIVTVCNNDSDVYVVFEKSVKLIFSIMDLN
jgi:hypothetical protein